MPVCLSCLGDGTIDLRDQNALMSEHLPEAWLVEVRKTDGWLRPVRPCDECDATGVISQERYDELMAVSRSAIEQLLAGLEKTT